ncbi:hypothetical protein GUITHDRAFT_144216 [Guillardia theta CCMP2712]|uniref:RWP-RK domain-containing protein n=1 Tax=Guillardia theta (strain CCMP2712) TaxID=905079 RepID=L1IRA7_GUITC|nr:hypothetical protein GUITHDRAFT_144216 [Guillardia theta CCMP2712]EKX38434.1 hypothetical protein GUITHDRAFT_144216 [Guillardia theta CCMP2712]|eukprot:XP_005825414.1 hypothetical protein GUITHDRAFT_144216 [Guillardia theta CCMP2712]
MTQEVKAKTSLFSGAANVQISLQQGLLGPRPVSSHAQPCLMHTLYVKSRPRRSSSRHIVQLSLPLLSRLFHLKQPLAADCLGISLTSLKSACRKLGLRRWPYERAQQRESEEGSGRGSLADSSRLAHATGGGPTDQEEQLNPVLSSGDPSPWRCVGLEGLEGREKGCEEAREGLFEELFGSLPLEVEEEQQRKGCELEIF